ncbi:hypothetical protein TNCV_4105751 [Trichonephila clavipes]|nr:hypothetical protein TNCV_4105751 [Trichonephila clavipes]
MITDEGIQIIAYYCRGLQQLNVQDCPITLDGYRTVKKFCKSCTDRQSVMKCFIFVKRCGLGSPYDSPVRLDSSDNEIPFELAAYKKSPILFWTKRMSFE